MAGKIELNDPQHPNNVRKVVEVKPEKPAEVKPEKNKVPERKTEKE